MARKTALYPRHERLGARFTEFAGWILPVQYAAGPKEEHLRVRRTAGLFDIDHMGQVVITGPDALPFLEFVMAAGLVDLRVGAARYSPMCYDDGGVVDDAFIYRLPDRYWVIVNAANNAKDTLWLNYQAADFDVKVENVSDETYMLALQGPRSEAILQEVAGANLGAVGRNRVTETIVAGAPAIVSRTGYTGEDGFEIYFATENAIAVWDAILEAGRPHDLLPVGLAARDSLRLEPGLPLYGQELTADTNPLQARLGWAVDLEKDFLGREALLKVKLEGPSSRLVGFRMTEGGVPRHGYEILVDGRPVGEVTSGGYAPSLDAFIGMGYVPPDRARVGNAIEIAIRGRHKAAQIVPLPFYKPAYRR